jgi:hypothetical protein
MYCLTEQQIDFILNDIRARGVEMEDLQSNLLDHICCIIEESLKEGEDFERFYQQTIPRFYTKGLWEIEEETITLLIFKNYHTMKKSMIVSGIASAILLTTGILFKFLQLPGASPCLVLGVVLLSLVFLPMVFTLKAKEKKNVKDKVIIGLGTAAGSLMSLSILFKVMQWPYSLQLGMTSACILLFIFLPIYFVSGIRNADTKVNVIVSSILLIGGCGLFFSLVSMKRIQGTYISDLKMYSTNEQILKTEERNIATWLKKEGKSTPPFGQGEQVKALCEELKATVWESETGSRTWDPALTDHPALHHDYNPDHFFGSSPEAMGKLNDLVKAVQTYNQEGLEKLGAAFTPVIVESTILQYPKNRKLFFPSVLTVLSTFSQVEMVVLQNESGMLASR